MMLINQHHDDKVDVHKADVRVQSLIVCNSNHVGYKKLILVDDTGEKRSLLLVVSEIGDNNFPKCGDHSQRDCLSCRIAMCQGPQTLLNTYKMKKKKKTSNA
jgi:hypothetical protein